MKRFLALIVFATLSLVSVNAAEAKWFTNYEEATRLAASEKKPLVINFTGSDWCGWCIRLNKEVFSQQEFVDYAAKNLVLLKLDFPRKTELPAAEKEQNQKLAKQYKIQGFPTIIVLDANAKQTGELGYVRGGPAKWLEALEAELVKK